MHSFVRQEPVRRLFYAFPRVALANRRVSASAVHTVSTVIGTIDKISVDAFRREAFIPKEPQLITLGTDPDVNTAAHCSIPAARKWFTVKQEGGQTLNVTYLEQFKAVVLPYELVSQISGRSVEEQTFKRFNAPLDVFLTASRSNPPPQLYIAQAQLLDLPQALQDDLPTPPVILRAGKGDMYDSNIWMGFPPTYTPLHKDPNPNLFLQLASSKIVRLFKPDVGAKVFRDVQERIRSDASAIFRGDEMMQGPERIALENAVWKCSKDMEGYEVVVRPGDALFIPKGWWHSIKSIGQNVTASVCYMSQLRHSRN